MFFPLPRMGAGSFFVLHGVQMARFGMVSAEKDYVWSFSLGFRPAFLPSRPYFRECVSEAWALVSYVE